MADRQASVASHDSNRNDQDLRVEGERDLKTRENGSQSPNLSSSNGSKVDRVKTQEKAQDEAAKKPSMLKKIWAKLDLDMGTALMMFK